MSDVKIPDAKIAEREETKKDIFRKCKELSYPLIFKIRFYCKHSLTYHTMKIPRTLIRYLEFICIVLEYPPELPKYKPKTWEDWRKHEEGEKIIRQEFSAKHQSNVLAIFALLVSIVGLIVAIRVSSK